MAAKKPGKQAAAKKPGRPPTHNRAAIMAEVCKLVATGMLVSHAAERVGVECRRIREWALDDEFAPLYARARESQAHAMAEDVIALADNEELPAESRRVRVDARKWLTSKIAPRAYGERQQHEHSGGVTVALQYVDADE